MLLNASATSAIPADLQLQQLRHSQLQMPGQKAGDRLDALESGSCQHRVGHTDASRSNADVGSNADIRSNAGCKGKPTANVLEISHDIGMLACHLVSAGKRQNQDSPGRTFACCSLCSQCSSTTPTYCKILTFRSRSTLFDSLGSASRRVFVSLWPPYTS